MDFPRDLPILPPSPLNSISAVVNVCFCNTLTVGILSEILQIRLSSSIMSFAKHETLSTSFTVQRVNKTTFLIREDDLYREHPFIYAKLHPTAPVLVLSDTGCDEPSEKHKHDRYIHLRKLLEHYPVEANANKPLNPDGRRQYVVITTHCHFDHTGGIEQFLRGGTTEIVSSAAGRDFIESDLESHGLFKYYDIPTPYYQVTKWAQAFEKLKFAPAGLDSRGKDLGITIIQTPGHTPDELAWYDHDEMHLYVGDSFYYEGEDGMAIIWPGAGNMVEWVFSMQKLQQFVKSANAQAAKTAGDRDLDDEVDDWVQVARRVQVSCAHQTTGVDGEEILADVEKFWWRAVKGEVPVVKSEHNQGEVYDTWRDTTCEPRKMSYQAPRRLMLEARAFFDAESEA